MSDQASTRQPARFARAWACGFAGFSAALAGCAGLTDPQRVPNIDRISRSGESFAAFLQSPGRTIDEIQELMPEARTDSVYLIDEGVTNEELGDYIQHRASDYPFEVFLRVTVSTANQRVYRYLVKGDWRSVKMGYGALQHPELYDAIYLHTQPRDKRVIPNSIADYIHADTFRNVSTLLVGNGIPIEFESIGKGEDGADHFDVDGQEFSQERPESEPIRSKEQLRRHQRDAIDPVLELDRIFTENVKRGHERVALRNSDGMLVTYERDRDLNQRLNEVYRDAGLLPPMEREGLASSDGISDATPSNTPRQLGY